MEGRDTHGCEREANYLANRGAYRSSKVNQRASGWGWKYGSQARVYLGWGTAKYGDCHWRFECLQGMLKQWTLGSGPGSSCGSGGLRRLLCICFQSHPRAACPVLDALVADLSPLPSLLKLCNRKCTRRWGRSVDSQNKIFPEFWPW